MITVTVNGRERRLKRGATVEDLLAEIQVRRKFLAVERNREVVPRTAYAATPLAEGDRLEIVSLVGGG